MEIQKTGGGSWKPIVTDSDAKILAILQDQIEPLPNPYDSGAVYFKGKGHGISLKVFQTQESTRYLIFTLWFYIRSTTEY